MDDLQDLNRTIAEYWLGKLDPQYDTYLNAVPVCLGSLAPSSAELGENLERSKRQHPKRLQLIAMNLRYLQLARVAAKDAAAGQIHALVQIGINWDHAQLLARLTDEDVATLAQLWQYPLIAFNPQALTIGARLRPTAVRQHATAYLAVSLA